MENQIEEDEHDVPASSKPYFNPKLYLQRYEYVIRVIRESGALSVLDLGCGDCSFLRHVTKLNNLHRIVGVDFNPSRLASGAALFTADFDKENNSAIRRKVNLDLEIYRGDVTDECDPRVRGVDLVSCIELVEHVDLGNHKHLVKTIFESIKPKYAVITTPNVEFNQHWPNLSSRGFFNSEGDKQNLASGTDYQPLVWHSNPERDILPAIYMALIPLSGTPMAVKMSRSGQLRHHDHRFEWTRYQFEHFVKKVLRKYPDYEARIDGVGKHWAGDDSHGYCSQIAIFKLINPTITPNMDKCTFSGLEQTFEMKHKITFSKYDFKVRLYEEIIKQKKGSANSVCSKQSPKQIQTQPLPPPQIIMVPVVPYCTTCTICSHSRHQVQVPLGLPRKESTTLNRKRVVLLCTAYHRQI